MVFSRRAPGSVLLFTCGWLLLLCQLALQIAAETVIDGRAYTAHTLDLVGGRSVTVHEERDSSEVGLRVWGGAKLLSQYLNDHVKDLRGKKVLELGSGTGLLGLTAAALGGEVTLTDSGTKKKVLNLLRSNADHPFATRGRGSRRATVCRVLPLTWGRSRDYKMLREERAPDLILAAGVIYNTMHIPALVATMTALSGPHTEVLLVYHHQDTWAGRRSAWAEFVQASEATKWIVEDDYFKPPGGEFTVLRLRRPPAG